ncbi:MAG: Na/Pi cotransporter family protein [Gammaproteobacteria bacterium]|nr:Na/Pi cotransporter family protein [Gammaproteobacteria bacterium]
MLIALIYGFWISPDFKAISSGVAVFLFGMLFLEQGFQFFTGGVLERILQRTTSSIWKSLSFGVVSTTLMQSSSLVSVITISFLGAGLIDLAAGVGIIFGANLGTTTGAWLIAGFGMKVKISAYAMPMLVIGIVLVFQKSKSLKGIGYILAGLGFLFLGIHFMKEGFEAFRDTIDLTQFAVSGYSGILLFTLLGIAATVIMQSSHATLVIIITALSVGQITYENGLALAIGANVGTTITAILGSMSSNIQGKRLAFAHLIFNMTTGAIAIAFIYQLVEAVEVLSNALGIDEDNYTLKLAVFHTIFNFIGVIAMLPFINKLVNFLMRAMPEKMIPKDKSRYLNDSSLEVPDVAIEAVRKEIIHLYDNAYEIIAHGLSLHRQDIESDKELETLNLHRRKAMSIVIDDEYEKSIKGLFGEIISFMSRANTNMTSDQVNEMFHYRTAGRDIVEAIKDSKHMHSNLSNYITSDNEFIKTEYNTLRIGLGDVLRRVYTLRNSEGDLEDIIPLEAVSLEIEEHEQHINTSLDKMIRENKITSEMATSLMNDTSYAYDLARSLVKMGLILFSGEKESGLHDTMTVLNIDDDQDIDEPIVN